VVPLRWGRQQEQCAVLEVLTEAVLPTMHLVAAREQQAAAELRSAVETERRQRMEAVTLAEAKQLVAENEAQALACLRDEMERGQKRHSELEEANAHLQTETDRDKERHRDLEDEIARVKAELRESIRSRELAELKLTECERLRERSYSAETMCLFCSPLI
jgi:hypothetical protein